MHLRSNYRIRFFAMLRSFSVILSISEISNFEILHCVLRLITISFYNKAHKASSFALAQNDSVELHTLGHCNK